ncbi:MAG: hypothetical protein ACYDH9_13895 [Limisphaerales bacterium]
MSPRAMVEEQPADLPRPLQGAIDGFARFLRLNARKKHFNGLVLSETALAKDWNTKLCRRCDKVSFNVTAFRW